MTENGWNFWLEDKLALLNEFIEQLTNDIRSRRNLNKMFLKELNKEIRTIQDGIEELKHWTLGNSQVIETRRLALETELLRLSELKRTWLAGAWKDIQFLKRQLRHFQSEQRSLTRLQRAYSNGSPGNNGPN
ncbi:MAG: hypothetical protein L0196_07140 [candidate division Zixibacteria bacterium]|nr:hypothetical protein [candidate division Zixibacteria bacterium]